MIIIIFVGLIIGTILFFCFAKPRDQTPITYEEQQRYERQKIKGEK